MSSDVSNFSRRSVVEQILGISRCTGPCRPAANVAFARLPAMIANFGTKC